MANGKLATPATAGKGGDGGAVGGEVLFAFAGVAELVTWVTWFHRYIGTGGPACGEEGADDGEEVVVGPVVLLEQRPEVNDEGVHLVVGPLTLVLRGHGLADGEPFGGFFVALRELGVEMVPGGFGPVVHFGVVSLGEAHAGKVAPFDVGIEVDGGIVPARVDVQMVGGVEPIAPALDGAAQ